MTLRLSRRQFVASAALVLATPALGRMAHAAPLTLTAERRTIEVRGKPASVLGLRGPGGESGLVLPPGEAFRLRLENRIGEPTIIHWHGQTPPPDQDGVTDTGYARPIADGGFADYDFAPRTGTHWMHSHHGLQEMRLLAAPLIVRTKEDLARDAQEVTVLLHDFSFKAPEDLVAGLAGGMTNHGGMDMGGMDHSAMGHMMPGMDLNDVEFDAYLANDRTLDDPQVVTVETGGRLYLRLINGAAATAFWVDFGGLTGTVMAVDGNPVKPVEVAKVPLAQGQRIDILLQLGTDGAAVPVLAQREGDRARTGIVLAPTGASVPRIADKAAEAAPPVDLSLESLLVAEGVDARPADVTRRIRLTGSMMPYVWTIDDRSWADRLPVQVKAGQRVAVEMVNESMMAHPMHLHGHHFDVVALNGKPVAGARRDTVLVPVGGRVTIAFDADNAGRWLFHCHNLLHMATGMMTEVTYA
ncbi:multicopper oxidase family protein [Zavarzinia sp.]|uniref:multicopper oxidase family protein n=1 Tax=Zavarzinia sp. TaxID=2027920 RepID=UPI003BB54184